MMQSFPNKLVRSSTKFLIAHTANTSLESTIKIPCHFARTSEELAAAAKLSQLCGNIMEDSGFVQASGCTLSGRSGALLEMYLDFLAPAKKHGDRFIEVA